MSKLYNKASLMHVEPFKANIILILIEKAVNKAIIQHERIKKDMILVQIYMTFLESDSKMAMTKLFADIHYYLVDWGEVNRLYKYLLEEQSLFKLSETHELEIKKHVDFRNHLEHLDERIKKGIVDLGNLSGDEYSFDKKSINIEDGIKILKEIYSKLIEITQANFDQPFWIER